MKLRYVLGLSLLAATVAFTSCKKDEKKDDKKEQNQEKQVTLDEVAGMYMGSGENASSFMVFKENEKLKAILGKEPLDAVFFTLGETKEGVATLKGETSEKITKAEGKFTVKDKVLELTVKAKDQEENTWKGTWQAAPQM